MFVISEYIDNNKLGFELDKIKCKIIYDRSDYWNYFGNGNIDCLNVPVEPVDPYAFIYGGLELEVDITSIPASGDWCVAF